MSVPVLGTPDSLISCFLIVMKTCNLLKELRAFCVTKQEGSMSKASELLFASQPTISLQIKTLEEQLKVKLFQRNGPKLSITTEGEILYSIVQPLVTGIDHLEDTFRSQYSDLSTGHLTITAEESTILYTLPEVLKKFVERYPSIKLKVANVSGDDGYNMLMTDETDLCISSLLTVPPEVEYRPFISYAPLLITAKDHPLAKIPDPTLKEIGKYSLILPPTHFSSWRLVKMVFALNGANYNVQLETGGWEVVKRYVSLNMGISIVTEICIMDEDKEKFAIIPLEKYFPYRKLGSVVRNGKPLSAPATRFLEILHEHYVLEEDELDAAAEPSADV